MHKHSSLKYTLLLAILCIGGFGYVFAQGNTAVQGELKTVATFLHLVISIMSWGRILFANIAGTFLTNARVYGEGIGLDIWLWKLRNIIRNISNFSL
ncbi:MAG: hypothetical protein LBP53_02105 [Candidatus Peribacteria bacterium]|jgi:hypothetical protein|nr:hypothetical protein [Candidatus Peribacteria bacterium]